MEEERKIDQKCVAEEQKVMEIKRAKRGSAKILSLSSKSFDLWR